jgi:hypothetical protein
MCEITEIVLYLCFKKSYFYCYRPWAERLGNRFTILSGTLGFIFINAPTPPLGPTQPPVYCLEGVRSEEASRQGVNLPISLRMTFSGMTSCGFCKNPYIFRVEQNLRAELANC